MPAIHDELRRDEALEAGHQFARLIADYFAATRSGDGPVSTSLKPAQVAERLDEPMPATGRPLEEVVARLRDDVIADSNRLMHPMYIGHQVSAPLAAAVWTDAVIAALNQSIAVWEMSPVATMIEHRVIRWMCDLVGLGPSAGGTLTSGGTEATFTALLAARAHVLPDAWSDGVGGDPPLLICGEHAHYAVSRAAGELGLGMRQVVLVPSEDFGMPAQGVAAALAEARRRGRRVMAVTATAGSTATGSFDDLDAIADVCDEYGVWLHVDAAHGGSAVLSARHRHRVHGLERARSIAWDPHKMMLLPLATGMLLVREERDLERAFSQKAPYLFHASTDERIYDQGIRSFQCSRRADAVKLWVAFQRYGSNGIGSLYDGLCDITTVIHDELAAHPDFEVVHEPTSNILCFRWTGSGEMDATTLDEINRVARERYNASGEGWITTTVLDGRRVLRVTVMNPRTNAEHARRLVIGLAAVAADVATELTPVRT